MNRITTPTLAWLLAATLLLIAGCSQEAEIPGGSTAPAEQGELIKVSLTLNALSLQQPKGEALSPQTKAFATERVIASQRTDDMLVELVETPESPATRASLVDNVISNFWLLQFDEPTENDNATTTLVKKTYYDTYTLGMGVELLVRNRQRLILLANTFDAGLGDRLPIGMTFKALLDTYKPTPGGGSDLLTDGGNRIPMCGSSDRIDITPASIGQAFGLPLHRTLTKVNVLVKNGNLGTIVPNTWCIQVCNVPNSYYFVPLWDYDVIFPAVGLGVSNYLEQAITFNEDDFTAVLTDCYLSPNMRGTVTGTSALQRPAKAPAGATYVKISGMANSTKFYTYTVHLGRNLVDDFNLMSNRNYTYRLTLYDNSADSRLDVTDLSGVDYVGMYGGELKKDGAGVWQFTKKLYVQNTDERGADQWTTTNNDYSALAGNKVPNYTRDGRQITWNLNRGTGGSLTDFPAANACYRKSGNPTDPASAANLVWYLPAQDQLLAVMVSAYSRLTSGNSYWSATEVLSDASGYGQSYKIVHPQGICGFEFESSGGIYRRCVREL